MAIGCRATPGACSYAPMTFAAAGASIIMANGLGSHLASTDGVRRHKATLRCGKSVARAGSCAARHPYRAARYRWWLRAARTSRLSLLSDYRERAMARSFANVCEIFSASDFCSISRPCRFVFRNQACHGAISYVPHVPVIGKEMHEDATL